MEKQNLNDATIDLFRRWCGRYNSSSPHKDVYIIFPGTYEITCQITCQRRIKDASRIKIANQL